MKIPTKKKVCSVWIGRTIMSIDPLDTPGSSREGLVGMSNEAAVPKVCQDLWCYTPVRTYIRKSNRASVLSPSFSKNVLHIP